MDMEIEDGHTSSSKLRFDGTISIGNIITLVSFVGVILIAYVKLDERSNTTMSVLVDLKQDFQKTKEENLKALHEISDINNETVKVLEHLKSDVDWLKQERGKNGSSN
jgi:hypothetical protein